MIATVKIVKGGKREPVSRPDDAKPAQDPTTTITRTIKTWIVESRERRNARQDYPAWLRESREEKRVVRTDDKIILDPVI